MVGSITSCENCSLSALCFPLGLEANDLSALDHMVLKSRVFQPDTLLFQESTFFKTLHIIRSGCVKTSRLIAMNTQRVTGFFIRGEILGLEAIYTKKYSETAVALDTVSLCEIEFERLLSFSNKVPLLQKQIIRLMSEKLNACITGNEQHTPAEKRIALFLLHLGARLKRGGLSDKQFILPMPKKDIADYLGIAGETLSRVLTKLHDEKTIHMDKREFFIVDRARLECIGSAA